MQGNVLPPTTIKIPVNMLKNWTYLFCCLGLFLMSTVLNAQDEEACLSLELVDINANPGEAFCVDIKAHGFQNILGFQWSIGYDPSKLKFTGTNNFGLPGLSSSSFGEPIVDPLRRVTVSWSSPQGVGEDVADESVIASLCFEPLVDSGKTLVEFLNDPTPIEFIDGDLIVPSITFIAAEVSFGNTTPSNLSINNICVRPSICGDIGLASVDVEASTSAAPLSYTWTGPGGFTSTTPSFEATAGGYYHLEVTNSLGEVASGSVMVSEINEGAITTANITPVPCNATEGGAIDLSLSDANPAYIFAWSNGATGTSIADLAPGTYEVTITSTETDCSLTQTYIVPQEDLRGGLFTKCLNENEVELWALLFDVEGNPYNYEWSSGETFTGPNEHKIIVPSNTGAEYTVSVTNTNGCSTAFQATLPNCAAPVEGGDGFEGCLLLQTGQATANKGDIVCVDVSVQDFENIVGTQFTVEWDPVQLAFNEIRNFALTGSLSSFGTLPSLLESGHVTLSWTDAQLAPITLTDDDVLFTLCFEVLADSGFAPVMVNGALTPMEAIWGSNPLEEFQAISFGSVAGGVHIGQEVNPIPGLEQICAEELGCGSGTTTQLIASVSGSAQSYSYSWEGPSGFSATEQTVEVSLPGLYSLTLTDQAGTSTIGVIQVEENATILDITAEITPVSCTGNDDGAIVLTEISNNTSYTYSWSNGATTRDIADLSVGEYTVSVTDNDTGCASIKRFQVAREGISAGLYYNCIGDSLVEVTAVIFQGQSSNYTFTWSNGIIENEAGQSTVQIAVDDSISVVISDNTGCTYTSGVLRPTCVSNPTDSELAVSYAYTCASDNQSAVVTAYVWDTGNGPYSFAWSSGLLETNVTQSSLTVLNGTSHQVLVSDALGNTRLLGTITPNCEGATGPPLELSIGEANANNGESVCLAVRAKNFTNILGMQYAVGWDADQLELNTIQNYSLPNLDATSFNLGGPNYENGLLRFAWVDLNGFGVTVPADAILYEMCFTVTGNNGEAPVFFDLASMQTEFINDNTVATTPVLDDGLVIINGEERMWPGDTDHNEVANHFDVLNLGLAFGATGPTRENANLIWRGQWATDWGQTTPGTAVDYKHIDTNGDGVINKADTTAISLNWGRAVNLTPNPMEEYRSSPEEVEMQGAPIYVEAYPVRAGETVHFNINLGDSETPVEGAYGLAFTVVYDPQAVAFGSVKASFQNSWLGELGEDMIALYKDDPNSHRLHVGITRIDQMDVNGSGAIGQISMTLEDVIFRDTEYEMPFRVENVRLIRASEEEIEVQQKQTIGTITDTPSNVNEAPLAERVKLFPNPTVDIINIQYRSVKMDRIQVHNVSGQLLQEYKAMNEISLQGLAPSTYILRFIGPDGVFLKKVIKQ